MIEPIYERLKKQTEGKQAEFAVEIPNEFLDYYNNIDDFFVDWSELRDAHPDCGWYRVWIEDSTSEPEGWGMWWPVE